MDKIYLDIGEISLKELKKHFLKTKPSNFKSIIFNNLTNGSLSSKIDLQFDEDFMLIDYQLSGYVKNLSGFFRKWISRKQILFIPLEIKGKISSLNGTINQIPVNSGEISFIKDKIIAINSTIKSDLELDQNKLKQIFPSTKFFSSNNQVFLKGNITSLLNLEFDNSFKVKKFDLNFKGKILESFLKIRTTRIHNFQRKN